MKKLLLSFLVISLAAQGYCQCLGSDYEIKEYFKNNIKTLDPIEGIWSGTMLSKSHSSNYEGKSVLELDPSTSSCQFTIVKSGDHFILCGVNKEIYLTSSNDEYLLKANDSKYFDESNTVMKLINGTKLDYTTESTMDDKISKRVQKFTHEFHLMKIFPNVNDYKSAIEKLIPSSGTGFAVSSNGIIVTNHHVINGATNIKIKGVNNDFEKSYHAKILLDDRNNDLTLLQIDDPNFTSLGQIPYVISGSVSDVGSSVFVLGYPLRATMGDEIKLTNGIISSKSGFKGDITTYQITAPVQPGNSGGPMFDDNGNLIGIINAKHLDAENVSYAIKTTYLKNLIESLPTTPKLNTVNSLSLKSLPEKVKAVKNFTYIIECN